MAGGRTGAAQGIMGAGADVLHALAGQAPPSKYIRAYHGSPLRERILAEGFDPARIGSNSGTGQGHGFYFSDHQDVSRHYGKGLEVEIAINPESLPEAYLPFADQFLYREPFFAAASAAPENKWKGDAISEILRAQGTPQLAYQSMLRAHNAGLAGAGGVGRFEAGRRASEALRSQGVPGMSWLDDDFPAMKARNYVIFPGAEDQIRILRKYGLAAPIAAGAMEGSDGRR
jgi:hypothetical protein